MKKIIFILASAMWSAGLTSQSIQTGKDLCAHCNMIIRDQRFASLAIDSEGNVQKFDAIECLINFLKDNQAIDQQQLLVTDYSSGKQIGARTATYLKSNAIPSPMGAYISAYGEQSMAEKVQKEKGGELLTWEELRGRFRDSRFGLLDHPDHHHSRPDAYAPIGVMGDHVHHRGSFMIGLSLMHMEMQGNLTGSRTVSAMEIHHTYMVTPHRMQMDMYMLGVMYAPTDKLTIMLMQPFLRKHMELSTMAGMDFETESSGLGDTQISLLYSLLASEKASFHVSSGASIPRGDISERDNTPMSQDMRLPYPMQSGSGTVDLLIGATFRQAFSNMSWGVQQMNTLRTGQNPRGYRQGNEFKLNAWGSYNLASWMSLSARAEGVVFTPITGQDADLNPMMSPAAGTHNSGFTRVRSFVGSNFSFSHIPAVKHIKVGLEYGLPVYQHVRGLQMNEAGTLNAGIRYLL